MSSLKHTPGPWNEEGIYVILRYADKHDMDIDEVNKVMPWSVSDAKLIAAAPEMLEALIDAYNILDFLKVDGVENIKYAIEKATDLSIEEVIK